MAEFQRTRLGGLPAPLFAVDLRGLGWALNFAGALSSRLEALMRGTLRAIGKAEDAAQPALRAGPVLRDDVGGPRVVLELPGMAVVHKPPGWEVDDEAARRRDGGGGRPLSSYLQGRFPGSAVARDRGHSFGVVHRLDVPSSGLLLAGTSFEGHYDLKWQVDTGQVEREYVVLCHGWVSPLICEIDVPIHHIKERSVAQCALVPTSSARRSTVEDLGRPSTTFIKVLAHLQAGEVSPHKPWERRVSLLAVRIRTGRRHQIRAHLHHLWHPTVTDGKYTRKGTLLEDKAWCPRNFLHRCRLAFSDLDRKRHAVTCALPEDLAAPLRRLRPRGPRSAQALEAWAAGLQPMAWADLSVLEPEVGPLRLEDIDRPWRVA